MKNITLDETLHQTITKRCMHYTVIIGKHRKEREMPTKQGDVSLLDTKIAQD
jgi:hypothetical protein